MNLIKNMKFKIKRLSFVLLFLGLLIFLFKNFILNQVIFKKENIQIANFYGNNENFVSAIKNNKRDLIENFLDEKKYNINYRDKQYHRSLLMWSLLSKNYFLTKKLIELGVDINIVDSTWRITPLHVAVSDQNIEIIKLLIERGHNVNPQESKLGLTPLDIAIKRNNKEIVQYLILNGAKKSSEIK